MIYNVSTFLQRLSVIFFLLEIGPIGRWRNLIMDFLNKLEFIGINSKCQRCVKK